VIRATSRRPPGFDWIVRRVLPFLLAAAGLAAALPAAADAARGPCVAGVPGPSCYVWTAEVRQVNDGDTMDVDVLRDGTNASRRIRFAGVQAMELTVYNERARQGDCHAVEATERVERLVRRSKGRVRLAAADPFSTAGRRLVRTVAVRAGGRWTDVGTILMREGLALWWPNSREYAHNATYNLLLQRAIATRRGLFDPDACGIGPSSASPLALIVNWDADGPDDANPSGEWVKIRNLDPVNWVPLGDWRLRDAGLRDYLFPPHAVLPPGGALTVNVGTSGDDATVFPWGLESPAFTNVTTNGTNIGDGAYLFDPLGNVRAAMVYPCRWQCSDPLSGAVAIAVDPNGRGESVTLTNVSAAPIDVGDHVLKSPPESYHLQPGTVLQPGGSLRIRVVGDGEDTELEKRWGLARPILREAGDVVRLSSYTDITVSCTAWGDRSC
jgi:endonuclease YncB( thermonuclease family)